MIITDDIINYVSSLARLDLDNDEKSRIKSEIEKIIEYMEILNSLDTNGIEPMSHVLDSTNVFRDDIVSDSYMREYILANAPECDDVAFCVPKTVE